MRLRRDEVREHAEGEEKSVVICGRGRGGSQACPKERKLRGPQFRSFSSSYPILSLSTSFVSARTSHWFRTECTTSHDDRRSPGRGCVHVAYARVSRPRAGCTPVEATHSATSLRPLTFSLQPRGTRGRIVRKIETHPISARAGRRAIGPSGKSRRATKASIDRWMALV